jgi:hypothetical protein
MKDSDYRDTIEGPMETLAFTLGKLGFEGERLTDAQLIDVATDRLKTLCNMLQAVVPEGVVKAVMRGGS